MDELYRVGERAAQDNAGLDPSLAEMLASGGNFQEYLDNYEQMLQDGFQPGTPQLNVEDAEGGITVRPEPGFVVKTRDAQTGVKVFLNVVSNEHVEAPHMKSFSELEGETGCRVPLSVGTPVEDFDKKSEPCMTYDLVANPTVVEECLQTAAFRDSVVQLCLAAVCQKYKVELDQRYKLPKMKYKGTTVQVQRLRKQRQSQIQELPGAPVPGAAGAKGGAAGGETSGGGAKDAVERPDFSIFYVLAGRTAPFGDLASECGNAPEMPSDAAGVAVLSGLDLPCYQVNQFHENFRGTMMNMAERQQVQAESAEAAGSLPAGEAATREMLAGRTCIVQVRMPSLSRQVAALKQFGVEVSDECLRISFPLPPRSNRAAYAPLALWWPHCFCSAQARADWDPTADTLTVSLPTGAPEEAGDFEQHLLDAVF